MATTPGTVAARDEREGLVRGRHDEGIQNPALTQEAVEDNETPKTADLLDAITEETAVTGGIAAGRTTVAKMKGLLPAIAVDLR